MSKKSKARPLFDPAIVRQACVECFRKLQEHGVELSIQRVPSTPVEDTNKLFA